MNGGDVAALIERMLGAGPLDAHAFGDLLGTDLKQADSNPDWTSYTFDLGEGPFSGGELRLKASGDGALLILDPRDPPGMSEDGIDLQPLGERVGARPNLRIPPEGIESQYFDVGGVRVTVQWTLTSRKLAAVILEWASPASEPPAAS